jgi:hypothetical protein
VRQVRETVCRLCPWKPPRQSTPHHCPSHLLTLRILSCLTRYIRTPAPHLTQLIGSIRGLADFGLLLDSNDGGSKDNVGLIIGVAIPLALVFVVGVITVVSLVAVLKRRAALAASRGAVSISATCDDDQL